MYISNMLFFFFSPPFFVIIVFFFFISIFNISFIFDLVNSHCIYNVIATIIMRKLFGANKKKKSSNNLKAGTLKIPIPMINGVEYADLTESQISTLIGGGNRDYHKKKLTSSLSSQRTNNTTQTEKTPSNIPVQQPVTPSRSISSPPILVMPKPMHSLPPTRYLLRNYDFEKTQVESSSDGSSSSSSEDEEVEEEKEKEHRIMSSPLPLKTEREGNLLKFSLVLLYNCIN